MDCRFDDAGLEELVTRRCVFENCVLTGVRMAGARHLGSAFLSCRFDRARLIDVTWDGCKLTGSHFPGAHLRPMTATECDWSFTSLRGADLSGLDLSGQRFREADLTDADLRECDLTRANLDRARLQGTRLRGADLRGASTDEINWRAFELTGVRLDLAQAVQFTRAHGAHVGD
ncbi:pentapeptide repeat-containing protein [Blastococcus sp. TF02-8]|uniref:pentapeptide repeat-containing protein n=1 Tax=Blastococcus sp. TF02-8 TaxID=2250574 RepID=UPI001F0C9DEB|nr:pentapeptide repeat-containing protein [Blastococcus sp. TF02-8]